MAKSRTGETMKEKQKLTPQQREALRTKLNESVDYNEQVLNTIQEAPFYIEVSLEKRTAVDGRVMMNVDVLPYGGEGDEFIKLNTKMMDKSLKQRFLRNISMRNIGSVTHILDNYAKQDTYWAGKLTNRKHNALTKKKAFANCFASLTETDAGHLVADVYINTHHVKILLEEIKYASDAQSMWYTWKGKHKSEDID